MITIFIKSYERDFNFLYYALKSINKNVKGNYDVLLMIDNNSRLPEKFNELITDKYKVVYVNKEGNGYLFQQYCKMTAYRHTNSEYILFSDSDVIFDHEINVDEFIADGKPEILYTEWDKVGDAVCWKVPTESFVGQKLDYEFMRRNCLIYHRSTLENIGNKYGNLKYIVMRSKAFSEFNAIGAWVWINERDKYTFINTDEWQYVPPKGEQLWTHATKTGSSEHVREYQRALGVINKTFDLNLTEL